ncbi:hypothetical protein GCM10010358_77490 [Streptomyces minutiscleroticus]|uniref:Uncharacterized protein n=1 Tax=Streptomyces minutiscleroticus TaxID=68238 RepID=A0A918P228_9ACTN|nr:hypothetical protein GCM10010358_77490 [Streptomyces minutiscleroticus]
MLQVSAGIAAHRLTAVHDVVPQHSGRPRTDAVQGLNGRRAQLLLRSSKAVLEGQQTVQYTPAP